MPSTEAATAESTAEAAESSPALAEAGSVPIPRGVLRGPRWLAWGGFLHDGHPGEPCWDSLRGFHLLRMEAHGPFEDGEEVHRLVRSRMDDHPRLRLQALDLPHDEAESRAMGLLLKVLEAMGAHAVASMEEGVMHVRVICWEGEPWALPERMDWAAWTVTLSRQPLS